MSNIWTELAELARERHYGHGERAVSRAVCQISRIPIDWCLGCKRGWHKHVADVTPADVTPPVIEPREQP